MRKILLFKKGRTRKHQQSPSPQQFWNQAPAASSLIRLLPEVGHQDSRLHTGFLVHLLCCPSIPKIISPFLPLINTPSLLSARRSSGIRDLVSFYTISLPFIPSWHDFFKIFFLCIYNTFNEYLKISPRIFESLGWESSEATKEQCLWSS